MAAGFECRRQRARLSDAAQRLRISTASLSEVAWKTVIAVAPVRQHVRSDFGAARPYREPADGGRIGVPPPAGALIGCRAAASDKHRLLIGSRFEDSDRCGARPAARAIRFWSRSSLSRAADGGRIRVPPPAGALIGCRAAASDRHRLLIGSRLEDSDRGGARLTACATPIWSRSSLSRAGGWRPDWSAATSGRAYRMPRSGFG